MCVNIITHIANITLHLTTNYTITITTITTTKVNVFGQRRRLLFANAMLTYDISPY